ncbi:MAG TPA: hypothetical protein VEU07_16700 [Candidatus Acidoferrum sp.]|nr:hypothetical protein [Candidatus Acidoferrum sp.]
MHDAVALESRGIPVAVVITTAFTQEAEFQRRALGMDALAPVIITHPLSSLTAEEIAGRAEEVATQAVKAWLGQTGPGQ